MKYILCTVALCVVPLLSAMAQSVQEPTVIVNDAVSVIDDAPPVIENAPAPAIEPGLWKMTITTESKKDGSFDTHEMTVCYTQERVAEELNKQLQATDGKTLLPNTVCTDKSGPVVNGYEIHRQAECQRSDGKIAATISSDCRYAGTAMRCTTSMSNGIERMATRIEGKRVGECVAETPQH